MNIIEKAKNFATFHHYGQKRKWGDRPYIYHPEKVVEYLQNKSYNDENLLAAAWCHDLIEDCPSVSYNILEQTFGLAVANIVCEVSHPPTKIGLPRKYRWEIYLQHYIIASPEGKLLKLADRIQNLQEFIDFWPEVDIKGRKFLDNIYLDESNDLYENLLIDDNFVRLDLLYLMNELDELLSEE